MNNTFNIKRFGLVLSKDFQENWKRYLLQLLTLFGVIAVVLFFISYNEYTSMERNIKASWFNMDDALFSLNKDLLIALIFLFLGFGVMTASTIMEPMRSKTKRISYLTNPASNFEKVLSRWLIVTIGYIIAFFAIVWLVDLIRVGFFSLKFSSLDVKMINFSELVASEKNHKAYRYVFYNLHFFVVALSFYILLQSLFVLGASFWEKVSFIKTFSAITVIVILYLLICRWTILLSYTDFHQFTNVLDSINYSIGRQINTVVTIITCCVLILFALINWTIAFFRFRESELIKRL